MILLRPRDIRPPTFGSARLRTLDGPDRLIRVLKLRIGYHNTTPSNANARQYAPHLCPAIRLMLWPFHLRRTFGLILFAPVVNIALFVCPLDILFPPVRLCHILLNSHPKSLTDRSTTITSVCFFPDFLDFTGISALRVSL